MHILIFSAISLITQSNYEGSAHFFDAFDPCYSLQALQQEPASVEVRVEEAVDARAGAVEWGLGCIWAGPLLLLLHLLSLLCGEALEHLQHQESSTKTEICNVASPST